jgi:WD40 repeat protein
MDYPRSRKNLQRYQGGRSWTDPNGSFQPEVSLLLPNFHPNFKDTKAPTVESLFGHDAGIYSFDITRDKLVTASKDTSLIIWNLQTYEPTRLLRGHRASVLCVKIYKYSDHRTLIYSSSADRQVICWDLETGAKVRTMENVHDDTILTLAVSKEWLITGCKGSLIKVWDRTSWTFPRAHTSDGHLPTSPIVCLQGHNAAVNCLAITSRYIISGSGDRTVKIWRIGAPWSCVRTISLHTKGIATLAISKDERKILTGSSDNTIRISDVETGEEDACLVGHEDLVRSVTVFPANHSEDSHNGLGTIISAGYDGRVIFWRRRGRRDWIATRTLRMNKAIGEFSKTKQGREWIEMPRKHCFVVRSDGERVFVSGRLPVVAIWQLEAL